MLWPDLFYFVLISKVSWFWWTSFPETKSSALSVQDEDQQINQSVEDTTKKGHSEGENNDQFSCSQCNKILKTSIR